MWDYKKTTGASNITTSPWHYYQPYYFFNRLIMNSGITYIGNYAFLECDFRGSLTIPDGVVSIGEWSFGDCNRFEGDLVIPDSVSSIGKYAFAGCSGFKGGLIISDNVTSVEEGVFTQCNGFTGDLIIPDSITNIGHFAFEGCSGFTGNLIIPDSVISIGVGAFKDCSGFIGELTLPNSLIEISANSFEGCENFTGNVIIPSSVIKIGQYAFGDCTGVENIVFLENAPNIENNAFKSVSANAYYPISAVGWEDCIKEQYGGSITWIPYSEGETPWLEEESDPDIPQILITPTYSNSNLTFSEMDGYVPKSFDISFGVSAMNDTMSGLGYQSLNNVKVAVTLPKGMSFSQDTETLSKEYTVGTLDGTIIGVQNQYTDTVYITTADYKSTFSVLFSATADGFEKPKETILEIPITKNGDVDYNFYNIQIYSEFPNCIIGTNQTCAIMPVMADGEDVLKNEEGWNFSIENSNIAEIQEYISTDYGTAARIIGKSVGNTKLHIIHIPTGKSVDLTISVVGSTIVYNLSDVTNYSDGAGIMNSGIFTTNYSASQSENGYNVTFDAYNGYSLAGAVEVYNAQGQLIQVKKINKFEPYQTGIKEVALDGWNLLASGFDGSLNNFTNSMYSEKTSSIEVYVPNGGYMLITNNITNSDAACIFNAIDISFWMYSEMKDVVKGNDLKKVTDDAQTKISQRIIDEVLGNGDKKSIFTKYQEKLQKSIFKKASVDAVTEFTLNLLNGSDVFFSEFDIDLKDEMISSAQDVGIGVATDIFEDYAGPAGETLKGIFTTNEYLNRFMQVVHINATNSSPNVRIDVNEDNSKLVSEGVIVEKTDGTDFVNTELVVVDVTEDDTSKYIIQMLSGAKQVVIYNITMYRDSIEIQPDAKIKVKVPLPATYNQDKCVIYRVEADNSLTDMKATPADGYLVFETNHLSLYALVEMENTSGNTPSVLVESIIIKNAPKTLDVDKTQQLIVEVLPVTASHKTVTWSSSNESIAIVSADGIVTGMSAWNVIITAKANDGSDISASVEIVIREESGGSTGGEDNPGGDNGNSGGENTGGNGGNTGSGSESSGGNSGDNGNNMGNNEGNVGTNNGNNESGGGNTVNTIDSSNDNTVNALNSGGEKSANGGAPTNISNGYNGLGESSDNSNNANKVSGVPTTEREPRTRDDSPVEIYATIAMIAGFIYILTYFVGIKRGMTEEDKNQLIAEVVRWAKRGTQFRRYVAYGVIFFLLLYYHSIGKRISVKWEEVYGK